MPKKSDVWQHFSRVTDEHGKFVNEAACNYCMKVLKTKDGTANMWKHLRKFHPQEADAVTAVTFGAAPLPQQQPPLSSPYSPASELPGGLSDHASCLQEAASEHLARMISLRGFDPSLLEDDCFRSFVASINPEFRVPSRIDMEKMCDGVFDERRKDLFDRMKRASGRLSLAVGTVTAIKREVLYTACHFIDDEWNLHKIIMDAYVDGYLLDPHGPLLGVNQVTFPPDDIDSIDKVMDDLSQRDVLDNLFFMVWETKQGHRVNCLELRNQIEQNKTKQGHRVDSLELCNTYIDSVIHSIARLLTLDPSFIEDIDSHLKDLDLTRQKTQKFLSQLVLDNLWAYDEDWYSSYCSLKVVCKEGHSPNTGSVFAELLCNIWGQMDRSIQRISTFNSPTSNLCLIELFNLKEVLQSELARASGDNTNAYKLSNGFLDHHTEGKNVADVLGEAMDSLDKSIKDSYLLWSIPLILDPWYKLTYIELIFKRAFVNSSEAEYYISRVTKQIKELYADYIEYGDGTNSANSDLVTVTTTGCSADPLAEAWAEHCSLRDGRSCKTELDRYLQDFLVPPTEF